MKYYQSGQHLQLTRFTEHAMPAGYRYRRGVFFIVYQMPNVAYKVILIVLTIKPVSEAEYVESVLTDLIGSSAPLP